MELTKYCQKHRGQKKKVIFILTPHYHISLEDANDLFGQIVTKFPDVFTKDIEIKAFSMGTIGVEFETTYPVPKEYERVNSRP